MQPGVDRKLVEALIERQAVAFQSMWGWDSDASSEVNGVQHALHDMLHRPTYLDASSQLQQLLDLPEWDEANLCAAGIPDLCPSWRVAVIADNAVFPPLMRLRSQRTILADQLPAQLEEWTTWIRQIKAGQHDDYLRRLHLHETSDFHFYHWCCLRGTATASLSKTTNWATKPRLQEVRQQILLLPQPIIYDVAIEPGRVEDEFDEQGYSETFEDVRRLLDLGREWNRNVGGSWKFPNYTENYDVSLTDFKSHAEQDWLNEFFDWTQRCIDEEFGFYLDY